MVKGISLIRILLLGVKCYITRKQSVDQLCLQLIGVVVIETVGKGQNSVPKYIIGAKTL